VIACDGIKSRVREVLLGSAHPSAYPTYSHQSVYRCLIPMSAAIDILGKPLASATIRNLGPGAHIIHFPIAGGTMMSLSAYIQDPKDWDDNDRTKMTAPASKADIREAFTKWGETALELVEFFPEETARWGIFDLADYPLDTYAYSRVCLAGDAAHATTPHQ
jgi:salicylate hydroxylase